MAKILNDVELRRLVERGVIVDGVESSIRPNSYILRLGNDGDFINTGKEFTLEKGGKRGIKIQAGHSVGVTALETIDFRRDAVHAIYPDEDLHGILSPTTDLSREGIVAPTTQIDAGYFGTLNWTLTNTSSQERRFIRGERLYRLTVFKLDEGETPNEVYKGYYQEQTGFVRSERTGPPAGMKESQWEDAFVEGGPENLLDDLIKSGYPWHLLGSRLKEVDQQFKTVTNEYSEIHDSIRDMKADISQFSSQQARTRETVREVLEEMTTALQNRWLIGVGSIAGVLLGLALTIFSNERALSFVLEYGSILGLGTLAVCAIGLFIISRQK